VTEASETRTRSILSSLPFRARVGLATLVVFALVSDGQLLAKALVDYVRTSRPSAVDQYLSRFGDIKTALPARGVVGYIAEPRGKELLHGDMVAANATDQIGDHARGCHGFDRIATGIGLGTRGGRAAVGATARQEHRTD